MLEKLVDILGLHDIDKKSDILKRILIARIKALCVNGKNVQCGLYDLSVSELKELIAMLEKDDIEDIIYFFVVKCAYSVKELDRLLKKEQHNIEGIGD